jgi:hypothetical protein
MLKFVIFTTLLVLSSQINANWFSDIRNVFSNNGSVSSAQQNSHGAITDNHIADALKQTLLKGSSDVINQLSSSGGFNQDEIIRIPLPDGLKSVQKSLDKIGMGGSLGELEKQFNQAAELATVKAKPLFVDAIKALSWSDVRTLLNGPDDAATRYFQAKMSDPLKSEMMPVVDESLSEVGAVRTYNSVMNSYNALPFVPQVDADLSNHVADKGIAGIFHYLAIEEKNIRDNPAKRTTELLRKVFSN